jgi:hypothetical protein
MIYQKQGREAVWVLSNITNIINDVHPLSLTLYCVANERVQDIRAYEAARHSMQEADAKTSLVIINVPQLE